MKRIVLFCILISLVFSCSKTDLLNTDCTQFPPIHEPVVCSGTLCQSDTCQAYFSIWKSLLLSRNQMTPEYFNNHIIPCETQIIKWNSGISFHISYIIKIDWVEVKSWDQFIIWISPSSGLYPTLTLPRNSLLTKDQINSAANIMAFSTSLNTISSINNINYTSLNDAMYALSRASGVDKLCTSEFYYENPNMIIPPIGHPFLRAYGVLNWEGNKCITSQLDLYTGETQVNFTPCMIIN